MQVFSLAVGDIFILSRRFQCPPPPPQGCNRLFVTPSVFHQRPCLMSEPCTPDPLLEALRALRVADPELGQKPLLAKLREQQPELRAGTKEVREALTALKAESDAKAAKAAAATAAAFNYMDGIQQWNCIQLF